MRAVIKKLKKNKGETIAETLVAIIIVALSCTMLAEAIVSAAKVNSRVKNENEVLKVNETAGVSGKVSFKDSSNSEKANLDVTLYKSGNGYYYYEN